MGSHWRGNSTHGWLPVSFIHPFRLNWTKMGDSFDPLWTHYFHLTQPLSFLFPFFCLWKKYVSLTAGVPCSCLNSSIYPSSLSTIALQLAWVQWGSDSYNRWPLSIGGGMISNFGRAYHLEIAVLSHHHPCWWILTSPYLTLKQTDVAEWCGEAGM